MSDYNIGSPDKRGMEWLAAYARGISLAGSNRQAIGGRFRADLTAAPTHVHPYLLSVTARSGLQFEIFDDQDAVVTTSTDYTPGTDTGATTTGWTRSSGAAGFYTYLATKSGSPGTWLYNSAQITSTGSLKGKYRASATQLTSATRVLALELWAYVAMQNFGAYITNTASRVPLSGLLDIGGVEYAIGSTMVPRDGRWSLRQIGRAVTNPATGLPWTITAINALLDAATDEFGWQVGPGGKVSTNGFFIGGLILRIQTCTENRYGYYYTAETPTLGISRQTLSGTRSLKAGDWYRWLLAPLSGEPNARIGTSALRAPQPIIAATPADPYEQRQLYEITLTNVGGVPQSTNVRPGEIAPLLLEDGSGIRTQSSPYASLVPFTLANVVGGLELDGATGYATLPDLTKFRISTAGAFQFLLQADDWTPGADMCVFSKSGAAGNRGYEIWLLTTGVLRLRLSEDGTAQTNFDSTVGTGLTNGDAKYIKITFAANSATGANFYLSDNGTTWTALGAAVSTAGFTDIHATTAPVEFGSVNGGGSLFDGRLSSMDVYADVAMQDVRLQAGFTFDAAYPDTTTSRPGDASIVAKAGGTITLAGAAQLSRRVVAQEWTAAAGVNAYGQIVMAAAWAAGISPNAPLDVEIRSGAGAGVGEGTLEAYGALTQQSYKAQGGGGQAIRVFIPLYDNSGVRTWTPTGGSQYVIVFKSAASANRGWLIQIADTLSTDSKVPKTTTTQANIEGASHQGQTDGAILAGVPDTRYDIPGYLIVAPGAPTVSVTVKEAT